MAHMNALPLLLGLGVMIGTVPSRQLGAALLCRLVFQPGEAFQFDWSEDWANIGGESGQASGCPYQAVT